MPFNLKLLSAVLVISTFSCTQSNTTKTENGKAQAEKALEKKDMVEVPSAANTNVSLDTGKVAFKVGNSILFTTYDGMEENGSNNNDLLAVPIAIYKKGKYLNPSGTEVYGDNKKVFADYKEANEMILQAVKPGKILYFIDNGKPSKSTKVIKTKRYGLGGSNTTYSALIGRGSKFDIATDNAKLGTNVLLPYTTKPTLNKRMSPDNSPMTDTLLSKIDIDGDGIPEFVYKCQDYEGKFYKIYSYKNGKWSKVYEGGYQGV